MLAVLTASSEFVRILAIEAHARKRHEGAHLKIGPDTVGAELPFSHPRIYPAAASNCCQLTANGSPKKSPPRPAAAKSSNGSHSGSSSRRSTGQHR